MVVHLSKNPSKSRILIVEDDKSIRETLREALVAEGYAVEVCKTGDEAQTGIFSQFDTSKKLDLVVLDLMLPNLNGIELCRRVRKNNIKTPILIVSAKDSESDRVLGLEVGADDYLIKPFGLNELIARCRAISEGLKLIMIKLKILPKSLALKIFPYINRNTESLKTIRK